MLNLEERQTLHEFNVAHIGRSYPRNSDGADSAPPSAAVGPLSDRGVFSDDPLATARGVILGLVLGALLWLTIFLLWPAT